MFPKKLITGLDIGTGTIRAIVAEERNGKPHVRMVLQERSAGVKRGAIHDLAECGTAVNKVLGEIRKTSRQALKTVYVNVGTSQIKTQQGRGVVAVSRADSEIYEDDIDRVLKASQAVNVAPNRMVVHNVTREYVVDGVSDISDPLGLSGSRLEVVSLIIDAFSPHVKNVIRLVELAGGRVSGLVLDPLAVARAVASKNQKDLGVVVVDIGSGTTGMSVYEESKLLHTAIFPVGAGHVTNDIAIGLRIPVPAAEQVKLNYGYALSRDVGLKDAIELKKFAAEAEGSVSRRLVSSIIEARLAEMLEFVHNELKLLGKAGKFAGGVVFVGGGAKIPGLTELGRQELKLACQIGCTRRDEVGSVPEERAEILEDPEFTTALGLMIWGAEQEGWLESNTSGWGKKFARYFWP